MKKPLITISRVNNEDVIATSSTVSSCNANLDDYVSLFQYNGVKTDYPSVGVKDNNYYLYDSGTGKFTQQDTNELYMYFDGIEESGAWYHLRDEGFYMAAVKCTNPESHHLPKN